MKTKQIILITLRWVSLPLIMVLSWILGYWIGRLMFYFLPYAFFYFPESSNEIFILLFRELPANGVASFTTILISTLLAPSHNVGRIISIILLSSLVVFGIISGIILKAEMLKPAISAIGIIIGIIIGFTHSRQYI